MSVFLTAAPNVPVIKKVWNLVDWIVVQFGLSIDAIAAVSILGAALCMAVSYLLGSISPAILISRRICGGDIRTVGRKTAGTYNMLLSYGKKMAIVSALCEFFIGYFAVSVSTAIVPFALAFAGGTMLYVISDEMIPETHAHGRERGATYSLLVGFCLMLLTDVLLG